MSTAGKFQAEVCWNNSLQRKVAGFVVTLGSEISLLGHNSKLAIKFGRISSKEDHYSLNYKEKYNRRFLEMRVGTYSHIKKFKNSLSCTNENNFQDVKKKIQIYLIMNEESKIQ